MPLYGYETATSVLMDLEEVLQLGQSSVSEVFGTRRRGPIHVDWSAD